MLAYIRGRVTYMDEESLVVENSGIGYRIFVPVPVLQEISTGSEVKIYTYLHVREDALCIYGFLREDDLGMFRLLIGVSGIGPKGALGVLSAVSSDDLRFAILSEDAKTISGAPGIGLKTARKLILELKDKISLEEAFETASQGKGRSAVSLDPDRKGEAVQALTALGYSSAEALRAVNQVENAGDMDTEALLKAALRYMAIF